MTTLKSNFLCRNKFFWGGCISQKSLQVLPFRDFCESMKSKRSHKRSLRGKHVVVQSSFFRRGTLSLRSSFMTVTIVVVDVICRALMSLPFCLSPIGCQMYLCSAVCCEEVTSAWMFHTPSRNYPHPTAKDVLSKPTL